MFTSLKRLFSTEPILGWAFEIDQAFLDAENETSEPIRPRWMRKITKDPQVGDFVLIATNRDLMTFIPRSEFLDVFAYDHDPAPFEHEEELREAGFKPVKQIKDL